MAHKSTDGDSVAASSSASAGDELRKDEWDRSKEEEDEEDEEQPIAAAEEPAPDDDERGMRRSEGEERQSHGGNDEEDEDEDEDEEVETQDYRHFAALVGGGKSTTTTSATKSASAVAAAKSSRQISAQTIRKGEKDFEEHGTRAQQDALAQSRDVMEAVLSHTRVSDHHTVRGWYFPGEWGDIEEGDSNDNNNKPTHCEDDKRPTHSEDDKRPTHSEDNKRPTHNSERVVMVELARGPMFASVGAVPGKRRRRGVDGKTETAIQQPGYDRVWLLPEETLFLVERGSMELWWPMQPIEGILALATPTTPDELDEDVGIPLSLQAAYALCIGAEDGSSLSVSMSASARDLRQGRVSLPQYQVYSHLRRTGFQVLRSVSLSRPEEEDTVEKDALSSLPPSSLWQWLFSLLSGSRSASTSTSTPYSHPRPLPSCGPLLQPGLYRSYEPIYRQLHLILRAAPIGDAPLSTTTPTTTPSFPIVFHAWKSSAVAFTKSRPPPPDFYISVADAHATAIPTWEEMEALLGRVPAAAKSRPASPKPTNPTVHGFPKYYRRLKLGRRNALVAVVDHGIVNFVRFADGTFADEPLWPRLDSLVAGFRAGTTGRGGGARGKGKGKGNYRGKGKGKAKGRK